MLGRLPTAVSAAGSRVVPARLVRPSTSRGNAISTVTHAAKTEGKLKEPPKRAPSAFNLFTKEKFSYIKQEIESKSGGKATLADVNVRLREMWGGLPDTLKTSYEKQAAQEKEKVAAAKAAWKEANPDAKAPRREKKKSVEVPGFPKPPNAYAAFLKENYERVKKQHPAAPVTEIAKLVAEQWKKLPEGEKTRRQNESKALLEQWKAKAAAIEQSLPASHSNGNHPPSAAAKAAPKRQTTPTQQQHQQQRGTSSAPPARGTSAARGVTPR